MFNTKNATFSNIGKIEKIFLKSDGGGYDDGGDAHVDGRGIQIIRSGAHYASQPWKCLKRLHSNF